ncbi:glucose-6-phosphate isomerase 1, chloroplastic-like isoform X2 [Rutidosis leptorrhynchoides]|uniref:glucose-6-phosphate isomerase 1, chloroplastic-like isoform X2 n=1 Tax=Rutidosis leptorrhynchoides TaxID=125765 RepID=UPI003A99FE81
MVVLPYNDSLLLFSRYLQQLVMESLGKEFDLDGNRVNQGLAVYGNKGSTDQHAWERVCIIYLQHSLKYYVIGLPVTIGSLNQVSLVVTICLECYRSALYANGR